MKLILQTNINIQKEVRVFIDQNLDGFNSDIIENIKIATNEVIQNIYKYSYKNVDGKSIKINLTATSNELILNIHDEAEPSNPEEFINKEYTPSENGQMGIVIIKKLTKSFKIFPEEYGNHTQLIFNLDDINHRILK